MSSIRTIIEAWPSRADLAADLGVSVARVHKWWQRESLPPEQDLALVRAATRRGLAVSLDLLARIRAGEAAPSEGEAA